MLVIGLVMLVNGATGLPTPSPRTKRSTSFPSPTEGKLVLLDMSLAVFCKHRTFLLPDIPVEHGQKNKNKKEKKIDNCNPPPRG